ncbi:MAG: sodium:proton antiporter [Chlorobium sp.]|jgi:Na+/H+ antiporter NhaD/arsenite permease-like protein|uniref:sodium:proton antiporter n=1 Tax=Chlorobium sp. TaxID=1095 RepID=UPI0025C68BDE|nr:sodium:proton antiporter [Chlorobium sp.]MCF8215375.1 sodium:proton antiporter [Chlorobium sp.]MCF8270213.1 sodium:proton antiporter [Chlorobium sp.]MCF8286582.1 sodium:proton antiporter [Chlorobium sp.]MCF8290181.1 sodium:proton antiporter [Chlorobium sp.]MCF8384340.1 sodium:proton antiporter [Chlorobium sp.]
MISGSSSLFAAGGHEAAINHLPPVWLVVPFVLLLLMIATGPLFYHRFWEHHYPKVAVGLAAIVAGYYGFMMDHGWHVLEHTLEEYLSFIALISSLFVVSGGILIRIERRGKPLVNGLLLMFGAVLANLIGTTGASMLLIRPFMRMNAGRLKPFHVVFFIFIVSNIGGGLTPIGDPPLFLGFLKGVPFFWVISKVWLPWLLTVICLVSIFMLLDARAGETAAAEKPAEGGISIIGGKNFIYLGIIIVSVFLDPAVISGFPSLQELFHLPLGVRELIMFGVAIAAYRTADPDALGGNEFNFEPIKEVAFLFVGIFATMIPALELIGAYASIHAAEFSVTTFYWLTGALSGVLDNAPTYLNFLAGALGKFGLDMTASQHVQNFASGVASPIEGDVPSGIYLMAISVASVFFGAMTYIGNAPNFMVKNIAAQTGVKVPDFLEYVYKYSLPVLIPVFALLWYLFFNY